MNPQRNLFVICYWLLSISLQAQTISGKVIDAKTLEPLPFANVFINNTTIGTTSEMNGEFSLRNVRQPASYEVIFSFVGYESFKMKVSLTENELRLGAVRLKPSEIELSSLEIKGTKDTEWEKKLRKFKKIFFGEDKAAELCMLGNPWVIDFPEVGKTFKATASAPLEIENKALGYKVKFYLSNFSGDNLGYSILGNVRFEEMQPSDDKEKMQWSLQRKKSYQRSRQHLFKSIIDHQIRGNGFNLYTEVEGFEDAKVRPAFFYSELGKTIKLYDTTDLVAPASQKDIYRITLKGRVEVHYTKEKVPVRAYRDVFGPVSWIRLKKNVVLVNKDGIELNPADVTVSGAMSSDRVAHLLPLDYLPEESLLREKKEELLPFLEEKIYVHTDKPYYYPGESIWFKGYVNYRAPSLRDSLSQTVYVELLERQKKKIKQSKVLRIDSGLFHGDFLLPDTLSSGSYYLRAYTNLNRNFGDNNLFVKPIPVLSPSDKVKADQSVISNSVSEDTLLTIVADKGKYQTRERITLTLRVKDEEELPLVSNISLLVTDVSQVVPIEISSSILDGYPLNESQVHAEGERLFHPIEYGISFTGRFYNDNKQPEKAMLNVFQLNPRNFTMAQSDEKGLFSVSGFSFYDTAAFSIQSLSGKGEAHGKVELLKRDTPPIEFNEMSYRIGLIKTESPQRIRYEPSRETKMLKEVEIRSSRTPEEYTTEYRIRRPYGKPNYVLKAKDINAAYGNLLLTLPGKFPGLVVRQADNPGARDANGTGPRWVVYVQKAASGSLNYPPEVLVTVNDAVVGGTPAEILGAIDPATVESIELKTGVNVLYGSSSVGGVLSVYTKKGTSEEEVTVKKNIPVIKVPGYSKPRRFSFPDYEDPKTNSGVTDYRSLLYWNPEMITDQKTGTASVSFFASDLPGRYRVVAEGVTQSGKPVRCVTFVDVASP